MTFRILIFLFATLLMAEGPYKVETTDNGLNVKSRTGTKTYVGDLGFSDLKNYRLEIPLSELNPPSEDTSGKSGGNQTPGFSEITSEEDLVYQANRLYNQGKFNEALRFVEELLNRNKAHVRGWMMKGSLMHALGQKDIAKGAWNEAMKLDPTNQQLKNVMEKYQ